MGIAVKILDTEHPDYTANKESWVDYELLFHAGRKLKVLADRFLVRRPKEPDDVYRSRLKRFIYTNFIGTIIPWYGAKLFRREPEIDFAPMGPDDKPIEAAKLSNDQETFFNKFQENCDRRGTTFIDFSRKRIIDMCLYGVSYTLVDLPYTDPDAATNLAEQKKLGALNPYFVNVCPQQVINWEDDETGNLVWIVVKSCFSEREFTTGKVVEIEHWTYYDRQEFTRYEIRWVKGQEKPINAEEIGNGQHACAALNKVPIHRRMAPDGMWLADRLYLPQYDYLNTENGYAWAMLQSNLAMPVLSGVRDEKTITISEVGVIFLPDGGEFKWSAPPSDSFGASEKRLASIREEAYRQVYLIAQGKSTSATASAQSGISKQQDMQPANDVLSMFGDIIRADQQLLLGDAAQAAGLPKMYVDVRGYSFEDESPADDLDLIATLKAMDIPSDIFDKELTKKAARIGMPDANQSLVADVMDQIDAAPTKSERQDAAQEAATLKMADTLRQAADMGKLPVGLIQPPAATAAPGKAGAPASAPAKPAAVKKPGSQAKKK